MAADTQSTTAVPSEAANESAAAKDQEVPPTEPVAKKAPDAYPVGAKEETDQPAPEAGEKSDKERQEAALKLQSAKRGKDARVAVQQKRTEASKTETDPSSAASEKSEDPTGEAPEKSEDSEKEAGDLESFMAQVEADQAPKARQQRRGSLMDMLSSVNQVVSTTNETVNKTAQLEAKLAKQRRHSRELEQMAFDMHLSDRASLQAKFDEIDTDKSGKIDATELYNALKAAGKNPTKKICDNMISQIAATPDEGVDFKEFETMIKDWDKILHEASEAEKRQEAALKAAAPQKFKLSNELTDEQKEMQRAMASQLDLDDPTFTPNRLSKKASKEAFESMPGRRSRRSSKESIPALESPAVGSGRAAAEALRSTPQSGSSKRPSKDES